MTASAFGQFKVTSGAIIINDNAQAGPYPSTNFVPYGSVTGLVEKVTVTLNNVTHGFPDDIDMILQGPDGTATMLMSDAGGDGDLLGFTFTLDSTVNTALPDTGQIANGGTYKPANYDGQDLDNFAAAPGFPGGSQAGLAADLSFFKGKDASAVTNTATSAWSLFVMDDTLVTGGNIGSWTLNLFMSPIVTITNIQPVVITEDVATNVNVFVSDSDTLLSSLNVTATSSDTNIVNGVSVSGNGNPRVLTITSAPNGTGGPVTITVTAKDETGVTFDGVNVQTFTVNVTPVNDAPAINLSTNATTIAQGGISPVINAKITDIDSDPAGVVLTATSSNPSVVNATNVLFYRNDIGGTIGTNRVIRIVPTGNATGTATITIIATDSGSPVPPAASTSTTINVTVNPVSATVGANTTPIIINDGAVATPLYPSTINVANVSGSVGKATVSLINVEHLNPADIGVMLVTPSGQNIILMRGVGDSQLVGVGDGNDVRINFDQDAVLQIDPSPIVTGTTSGSYRPNDTLSGDFPAPAPSCAGGCNADLSFANGTNPNGAWKLYVYDATGNGAGGQIAGGWVLQINPGPAISNIGAKSTPEDTAISFNFTVSGQVGSVTNVTAISQDHAIAPDPTITLSGANGDLTRTATLSVTPVANANGPVTITVTAKDNQGFTVTQNFTLTVTPVNDNPTITAIHDQLVRAGQTIGPITFNVNDVETAPDLLTVSITGNDNPKLLPPGSIVLGGSGTNRTITVFPVLQQGGIANLTLTVSDGTGGSASTSFALVVQEAANKLWDNSQGIAINDNAAGSPYPSVISVSGMQPQIAEVQVTLFGITHPEPTDIDVLLVGPGNSPVALTLMSDAGGFFPISNTTLRFRQSAPAGALPQFTQITSGDYIPSDYEGQADFPAFGSPAATPSATLSSFIGTNPNGDWKLYVVDDTPSTPAKGGVITSWQLSIRTHPVLATIPDVVTSEDKPAPFSVNLGDHQPGVSYTVNVSSTPASGSLPVIQNITTSTGQLIPITGLQVPGASPQSFIINPLPDASGTNNVTISFTDPDNITTTQNFKFIVTPVDDPPRFTGPSSPQTVAEAGFIVIPFSVVDPEGTAVKVVASSDQQSIISDGELAGAVSPENSTDSDRNLTIVPHGTASGDVNITLTAIDAGGNGIKSTKSFLLHVTPNLSFQNRDVPIIAINDNTTANPYPSVINVAGINGTVSGVSVVLVGLTHSFPDDIDVLLVSPDGRPVMLMSDAGGGTALNNARVTLSMSGTSVLPDETQILSTVVYQPANYNGGDIDEMPGIIAPAGGFSSSLNNFIGANPNGNWSLYIRDDTFTAAGTLQNWILTIQTTPSISAPAVVNTLEDTPVDIAFTVTDQDTPLANLTVSAGINPSGTGFNNPGLITSVQVNTNSSGVPISATVSLATNRPFALNATETNSVTLTVSDGNTSSSATTLVIVKAVNDLPDVAGAFYPIGSATPANLVATAKTTTNPLQSHPITIRYLIKDADSILGVSTNVTVVSGNPTVLPNTSTNITLNTSLNNQPAGTTFNLDVTLTPAPNQVGQAVLNVIVHDELNTVTNSLVTLSVTNINNLPSITMPGLAAGNATNIIAGGTLTLPFTVSDNETPADSLILSVTSDRADLIPTNNITISGRGSDRSITLVTTGTATGTASIGITAKDADGGTTTFTVAVTVTPALGTTFGNNALIHIPNGEPATTIGAASIYPSPIVVPTSPNPNLVGNITRITVTLEGITHTAPDDLDVLLVSPAGKKVMLMSDAGGRNPISNVRLVFDSANPGAARLPDEGLITSGTYVPTDYEAFDTMPSPAPAGPYVADLAEFIGTNPNGTWNLYIADDANGDSGQLLSGWTLRIETGPIITLNSGLNTPPGSPTYLEFFEDAQGGNNTIQITVSDQVTPPGALTLSINNSSPDGIVRIAGTNITQVSTNATSGTYNITFNPVTNAFGTNNAIITVTRSDKASSSITVPMNIAPVNDVPALGRLLSQSTQADVPLDVPLLVSDVDTALSNIVVLVTSDNPALITNQRISVGGSGTNVLRLNQVKANATNIAAFPPGHADSWTNVITLTPNPAQQGSSTITVELDEYNDAGTQIQNVVLSNFVFTVTPVNHSPTISGAGTNAFPAFTSVEAGKTTNILFQVGDADNDNLTILVSSDRQDLVRDSDIKILAADGFTDITGAAVPPGALVNGANRTLRITTQAGVQGDANVSISVRDPSNAKTGATIVVHVTQTRERVFSNNQLITITDNSVANPYPSSIPVDLSGTISKVTLTINGFWHTFPGDVDMIVVAPDGKASYVMSDAGGGGGTSSIQSTAPINMRFDDTDGSAIPIPVAGPLTSRTYKVANYEGTTDVFPAPAPQGTIPVGLNTFNGSSPKGTWSLFIVDDTASDFGAITNGWTLGITILPSLEGLPTTLVTGFEDKDINLPFVVNDPSNTNGTYSFTVASSNPALVPASTNNIIVTGSGTNFTLTIHPAPDANDVNTGTNVTTVTITEQTTGVSAAVKVSFAPVNDEPRITGVPTTVQLGLGTFTNISTFNYSDVETTKKDLTNIVITSDNTAVIPNGNVIISGDSLLVFSGTQPGTAKITIAITDPQGATGTASFTVTVGTTASDVSFSNNHPTVIIDNSRAADYPWDIPVTNVNGTVASVSITLLGLSHPFPDDIDMLLVGPNGQGVVLMSDVGGGGGSSALNNAGLIISDAAATGFPDNGPIIPFKAYKPTNVNDANNLNNEFLAPAPAGPYATTLGGAFNGIDPNGTWSLFIQDDASPDAGSIQGWVLNIALNEVGPTLTGLNDTNALEDAFVLIPFTVGSATPDAVSFVTSASNSNLVSSIKVGGSGTDRQLQITLVPDANGTSQITVAATDATGTRTRTLTLTVAAVNDAPIFGPVADIRIGGPTNVVLNITDIDTPLTNLTFQATTAGTGLIADVTVSVTGNTVTAHITPVDKSQGTDAVTISVSDGTSSVSQTFRVTVVPPGPPILGSIPDVNTPVNTPVTIPIIVSDTDTPISDLAFFATSSGTVLVQSAAFTVSPSNTVTMTITPATGQSGTERVTVHASDGTTEASTSFNFTVLPPGPVIAPIPNQTTAENVSLTIPLTITDADTPLGQLALQGSTDNPSLVKDVTFIVAGPNVTATIILVTNASGSGHVTITASDGASSASQTFLLTVTPTCKPPVIGPIAPQTATGSTINVTIPVADPDDPNSSLTFQTTTAGSGIVTGASYNVAADGTVTGTFTLAAGATGTEQVTVTAADGCGSGSQTFSLTAGGPATPPTLSFALSGTNFVITVGGTVGSTVVIEGSSDLKTWAIVSTVTIGAGGTGQVTVPATGKSQFFRARAGVTPAAKTALLVVGNTTLVAGDLAVSNRLASLGYTITTKAGPSSVGTDANGKSLVVISSTIASADGIKFATSSVPIVHWEQALTDDFKFNGDAATDHSTMTNQTDITILATSHPLAAGLPAGLRTVATSPTTFSWGNPQGDAIKIATMAGIPSQVSLFGYEAGATMLGTNKAPARRVFLFLQDPGLSVLNTDGVALFDAAINWAAVGQ